MKLFLFFVLILLSSGGRYAFAGNEVGNGADEPIDQQGNAWFVQLSTETEPKKIRYCYHLDSSMGVEAKDVEKSLQEAFEIWTQYMKSKAIQGLSPVRIISDSEWIPSCNGQEDLRFELGTSSAEISEQKKKYLNPTAFAVRSSFDLEKGWSSGWIWLASKASVHPEKIYPDWTQEGTLTAILLHELGHVFGCSHIPGTIMAEDLVQELESGTLSPQQKKQIDHTRELLPPQRGFQFYKGVLGRPGDEPGRRGLFEKLTGRKASGAIKAQVFLEKGAGALWLKDDLKELRWPLILSGFRVYPNGDGGHVFRYRLHRKSLYQGSFQSEAFIQSGTLPTDGGENLEIVLEFNLENVHSQGSLKDSIGPVNLKFNEQGSGFPLFTSDPL